MSSATNTAPGRGATMLADKRDVPSASSTSSSARTPQPRLELGPLTTVFTPDHDCSTLRIMYDGGDSMTAGYGSSCRPDNGYGTVMGKSCMPGMLPHVHNLDAKSYGPAVFSPGNQCPQGYWTACTFENWARDWRSVDPVWFDGNAAAPSWDVFSAGETAIGCCPTGYNCATHSPARCSSRLSSGVAVTVYSYNTSCHAATIMTTAFSGPTRNNAAPTTGYWDMVGAERLVMVQNGRSSHASGCDESGNGNGDSGFGLSREGVLAIAITVPLVVVLGAALLGLGYRRKRLARGRRSRPEKAKSFDDHDQNDDNVATTAAAVAPVSSAHGARHGGGVRAQRSWNVSDTTSPISELSTYDPSGPTELCARITSVVEAPDLHSERMARSRNLEYGRLESKSGRRFSG